MLLKRTKFSWFSSLIILCLLLCSCQATPEEDFVIGQVDESIYDNGGKELVPVNDADGYGPLNWKEFSYQDSFEGADKKAEIHVDITGKYLDESVPVLRVKHHTVTVEDLKRAAQVLMPAEKYYDPTKLIDAHILEEWIKTGINSPVYEEMLEQQGKDLESDETDWQEHSGSENYYSLEYRPDNEESSDRTLMIRTQTDENGDFGFLQYLDVTSSGFCSNELEYYKANGYASRGFCYGSRDKNKDPENTLFREEEAVKTVEKLKGLDWNMHPCASMGGESGMTIWFYPTYLGVDYLCAQKWSEYAEEHRPECLYANIRGNEAYHIKRINATDAYVEKEGLPLISKDEALAAFKKYMQTVYTGNNAVDGGGEVFPEEMIDEAESIKVEVNRMNFGYVRIPIKDNSKEFRLVPAWVFCGQSYLEYEGEVFTAFPYDANPGIAEGQILMVVNAIDGSYIEAEREMFE